MRYLQQHLRFSWHCCRHQADVRAGQVQSHSHTNSFSTASLKLPAEELITSPANAFGRQYCMLQSSWPLCGGHSVTYAVSTVKQCVRLRDSAAFRQEQGFILIVGQTALDQLPASCQTAAHLSVDGSTAGVGARTSKLPLYEHRPRLRQAVCMQHATHSMDVAYSCQGRQCRRSRACEQYQVWGTGMLILMVKMHLQSCWGAKTIDAGSLCRFDGGCYHSYSTCCRLQGLAIKIPQALTGARGLARPWQFGKHKRGSVMLGKLGLPAACRHDTACLQSLAWSPGQLAQA